MNEKEWTEIRFVSSTRKQAMEFIELLNLEEIRHYEIHKWSDSDPIVIVTLETRLLPDDLLESISDLPRHWIIARTLAVSELFRFHQVHESQSSIDLFKHLKGEVPQAGDDRKLL